MSTKDRKTIMELARRLRKNPTPGEKLLWQHLRKRKLGGFRFLRQKPLVYNHHERGRFFYIADFYCAKGKLVVELDGKIHEYQKDYDYNRDLVLERMGLKTIRIKNKDLKYLEMVKRKILSYLS